MGLTTLTCKVTASQLTDESSEDHHDGPHDSVDSIQKELSHVDAESLPNGSSSSLNPSIDIDNPSHADVSKKIKVGDSDSDAVRHIHVLDASLADKLRYGNRGDRGKPGPIGTYGIKGTQGRQGHVGNDGVIGDEGLPGYRGPRGPVGRPGPPGDAGKAGPLGDVGPLGPLGRRGPPGERGQAGKSGPMWRPGKPRLLLASVPKDHVFPDGVFPAFIQKIEPIRANIDIPEGDFFKGEGGLQGLPGREGFEGDLGVDGAIGLSGYPGRIGNQGITGVQGEIGNDGPEGRTGPEGNKGETGYDGSYGLDGDQGPDGCRGPRGPMGPAPKDNIAAQRLRLQELQKDIEKVKSALKDLKHRVVGFYDDVSFVIIEHTVDKGIVNPITRLEMIGITDELIIKDEVLMGLEPFNRPPLNLSDPPSIYPEDEDEEAEICARESESWTLRDGEYDGFKHIVKETKEVYKNLEEAFHYGGKDIVDEHVPVSSLADSKPHNFIETDEIEVTRTVWGAGYRNGPKGFEGAYGPQGDKGAQGVNGERGDQGRRGGQGYFGAQGNPGDKGRPGEPGPRGDQGRQGSEGKRGPRGHTGPLGRRGPRGVRGPEGPAWTDPLVLNAQALQGNRTAIAILDGTWEPLMFGDFKYEPDIDAYIATNDDEERIMHEAHAARNRRAYELLMEEEFKSQRKHRL